MNSIHITGRLCADPEIRTLQSSGTTCCRLQVAVNRRFANKQTGEREADFISCIAWGHTADFIGKYFFKGNWIEISGELRNNNYTDQNGVKHYAMVVWISDAGFVGNKNSNQNAPQQPQAQQPSNYTAVPPNVAQGAAQQQTAQTIGDLSEFEDILSDPEVPF